MESPEHEVEDIRGYVEGGWSGGRGVSPSVTHLEKVASEKVWGLRHDVWDVHTTDGRWWVVTNPANLYTQDDFKSMDVVLSFHIGLMARVAALREPQAGDEERARFAGTWRRWEQAVKALDQADEAEEFQAVGMRLRETLLTFIREVADDAMVSQEQDPPKAGDFVHWAEYVAGAVASGSSAEELRSYLKAMARETWKYVAGLTHKKRATRHDAELGAGMVDNLIGIFGSALVRWERGSPDACPACGSYRIAHRHCVKCDATMLVTSCEACGWLSELASAMGDHGLAESKDTLPGSDCVLTSDISTVIRPEDVVRSRQSR